MKTFLKKYSQIWVLLYVFIYFPWFFYLEKTVTSNYTVLHTHLDDRIPFIEYFIIPYLLWFIYIIATVLFFLFKRPKADFYRLAAYLFGGMSICLLICTIFPNGLDLRPELDPDKNIFTKLISVLYTADTNTNVFPSIHVFASIGAHTAISRTEFSKRFRFVKPASAVLMVLIILSTMFLKQHSVIDVIGAIVLSFCMYGLVYFPVRDYSAGTARQKLHTRFNKISKDSTLP